MVFQVDVDSSKCNGCHECVAICPKEVFELQKGKSVVVRMERCHGCESCLEVCEPGAILVTGS